MADLFRSLFEQYGHVYQSPRYKKDTGSYEWNMSVILDDSFDFLLEKGEPCWTWVGAGPATLWPYLAGFIDAEGSIGIYRNGKRTALQVLVYNTDFSLIRFFHRSMGGLGYQPVGPYLDKPRGTVTSKYRIKRKKDYWKVALTIFEQAQDFVSKLPIKHGEKVRRKLIAQSLNLGEPWASVEPRVKELQIRKERDTFVAEAEEILSARATSPKFRPISRSAG
jgi:hypothetical protein